LEYLTENEMKNRQDIIEAYNATSTDDGNGEIETYENWLERQLIHRVEMYNNLTAVKDYNCLHSVSLSEFVESNHNEAKCEYEEHEHESDYEAQYWWGRLIAFGAMKKFIKEFHSS